MTTRGPKVGGCQEVGGRRGGGGVSHRHARHAGATMPAATTDQHYCWLHQPPPPHCVYAALRPRFPHPAPITLPLVMDASPPP